MLHWKRVLSIISVLLCAMLLLTACSTYLPAPVKLTTSPPVESVSPTVDLALETAVTKHLGPVALLVDVVVQDRFRSETPTTTPFAFCFVRSETTPTLDGALALLLTYSAQQDGSDRHVVLRVDIGPEPPRRGEANPTVVLFWNPTDVRAYSFGYDMAPGPHSLGVWASEGGSIFTAPYTNMVVSNVTTETLTGAANRRGGLYDRLRKLTRLK